MPYRYLIFNTENEAVLLNKRVTDLLLPTWADGVTNNYCTIKKHPVNNNWAVIIDSGCEHCFTQAELLSSVELGVDWIPKDFINNILK